MVKCGRIDKYGVDAYKDDIDGSDSGVYLRHKWMIVTFFYGAIV